MREDMFKVITERPRRGGTYNPLKGAFKQADKDSWNKNADREDHRPLKESMKEVYRDRKYFDDHLSPLLRFIESKVGTPWNKVYSEVCERLPLTSTTRRHVREHVDQAVETKITIRYENDKKVYCDALGRKLNGYSRWKTFFVDEDGILRKAKQRNGRYRPSRDKAPTVDMSCPFVNRDGHWYECLLRPVKLSIITKENRQIGAWRLDYNLRRLNDMVQAIKARIEANEKAGKDTKSDKKLLQDKQIDLGNLTLRIKQIGVIKTKEVAPQRDVLLERPVGYGNEASYQKRAKKKAHWEDGGVLYVYAFKQASKKDIKKYKLKEKEGK